MAAGWSAVPGEPDRLARAEPPGGAEPPAPGTRSVVGSVPPAVNGGHRATEKNVPPSVPAEKVQPPSETIPLPAIEVPGGTEE